MAAMFVRHLSFRSHFFGTSLISHLRYGKHLSLIT